MSKSSESDFSLLKFVAGVACGVALASGYVKWGWQKPAVLEMPEMMTASVIAATVSGDMYDLDQPLEVRERALEVIAQQRPDEIARLDREELNHAVLNAFYRRRARREARALSMQWTAYDEALKQPSLRRILVDRYGVDSDEELKQSMLAKAFRDEPFLSAWIAREYGPIPKETLLSTLHEVRRGPMPVAGDVLPMK